MFFLIQKINYLVTNFTSISNDKRDTLIYSIENRLQKIDTLDMLNIYYDQYSHVSSVIGTIKYVIDNDNTKNSRLLMVLVNNLVKYDNASNSLYKDEIYILKKFVKENEKEANIIFNRNISTFSSFSIPFNKRLMAYLIILISKDSIQINNALMFLLDKDMYYRGGVFESISTLYYLKEIKEVKLTICNLLKYISENSKDYSHKVLKRQLEINSNKNKNILQENLWELFNDEEFSEYSKDLKILKKTLLNEIL